ncbi:MAG: hypothetical protein Q9162_001304 [Coniocarpon cinnabarinum]
MVVNEPSNIRGKRYVPEALAYLNLDVIERTAGEEPSTWAKFALANEHANQFHGGQEWDLKAGRIQKVLRWAPHTVLYGHPFITSPWLAEHLNEAMTGEPIETERAFLFASCMMSITHDGLQPFRGKHIDEATWINDACKIGNNMAKLYRAIAFRLFRFGSQDDTIAPLNRSNWHDKYLESLDLPEYLTSGTWVGYYSHHGTRFLDPPMTGVKFRRSMADNRIIFANGIDRVGSFQLNEINWQGTSLDMVKDYGPFTWRWQCKVTPFGIFGTWHSGASLRVNGSIWLWKEEWMTRTRTGDN